MMAFRTGGNDVKKKSLEFDNGLKSIILEKNIKKRKELIKNWKNISNSKFAHPTSEHLMPLFVIAGTAFEDDKINITFDDYSLNAKASAFSFVNKL